MRIIFIVYLFLSASVSFGQATDTLQAQLKVNRLLALNDSLIAKGLLEDALEKVKEAEKISQSLFGKTDTTYEKVIHQLGKTHQKLLDFEQADHFFKQSKNLSKNIYGQEHLIYLSRLETLAHFLKKRRVYHRAEPLYLELLELRKKTLGKEHPSYIETLLPMASSYMDQGLHEKSAAFYKEAKDLIAQTKGTDHPLYGKLLNRQGILNYNMGNYEEAEQLFIAGMEIQKKALGKRNPQYAWGLNFLGLLYSRIGNFEKAEQLLLESKELRASTIGTKHPDYAWSLNNLAELYYNKGEFEKAEPLFEEANNLFGQLVGTDHPDYAITLNHLASLHWRKGNFEKAESYFLASNEIIKKSIGKKHSRYATNLNNLAGLYTDMSNFQKAEQFYQESLSVRANLFGKSHLDYVRSLGNLAQLYFRQGDSEKAKPLFLEASDAEKVLLTKAARHLSEKELSAYIQQFEPAQNIHCSLAEIYPEHATAAYDNALFYKGFLLNANGQINRMAENDPTSNLLYKKLKSNYRQLAAEYTKPLIEQNDLAQLEESANLLEKELTRKVAGFGAAVQQVNWQEVQQQLQPNEAAIEFVEYYNKTIGLAGQPMYAALILRPKTDRPIFAPLCRESDLKGIMVQSGDDKTMQINEVYKGGEQSLYHLLWQPLEKELAGVHSIYYAPAGLLHRLNLGALSNANREPMFNQIQMTRLGSTRQLVIPHATDTYLDEAVVYGGIQFDIDTNQLATQPARLEVPAPEIDHQLLVSRNYSSFELPAIPLRGSNWNDLSWTGVEASSIQLLMEEAGISTTLKQGKTATEETFKTIGQYKPSPRILHLATHGFFFPDPSLPPAPSKKGGDMAHSLSLGEGWGGATSEHPMIRSGLIMAGGNYAWKNGKPFQPHMEDGILTAYEISQMDLSNTELVVLSACETGLGDIEGNEGVYGLQRAFKIAGAKNLIMSLWQVPDFQTQELMTTFYTEWLQEKKSIAEALRSAQKQMREKYKDPFFWAGFVLVE